MVDSEMMNKLNKFEEKMEMEKENNIMNEREYIIAKAKELGITAEELGIAPQFVEVAQKDWKILHEVAQVIRNFDLDFDDVRDAISEEYWDDLGIAPKKYKLVECTLRKTIYKKTMVAMPEDEDESNVEDYLSDIDMEIDTESPDDEEDWEIDDYTTADDNLTEEDVRDAYNEDEVYNYHNFAD